MMYPNMCTKPSTVPLFLPLENYFVFQLCKFGDKDADSTMPALRKFADVVHSGTSAMVWAPTQPEVYKTIYTIYSIIQVNKEEKL